MTRKHARSGGTIHVRSELIDHLERAVDEGRIRPADVGLSYSNWSGKKKERAKGTVGLTLRSIMLICAGLKTWPPSALPGISDVHSERIERWVASLPSTDRPSVLTALIEKRSVKIPPPPSKALAWDTAELLPHDESVYVLPITMEPLRSADDVWPEANTELDNQELANLAIKEGQRARNAGDFHAAELAIAAAEEAFRALNEQDAPPEVHRFELAVALANRADVCRRTLMSPAAYQTAESCYRLALSTVEDLLTQSPFDPRYLRSKAVNLNNLGLLLKADRTRRAQAVGCLRASTTTMYELLRKHPNDKFKSEWASFMANLAELLGRGDGLEQAEAGQRFHEAEYALDHLRELSDADARERLAGTLASYGTFLTNSQQQPQLAARKIERSIHLLNGLIIEEPAKLERWRKRWVSCNSYANLLRNYQLYDAASRLLDTGFAYFRLYPPEPSTGSGFLADRSIAFATMSAVKRGQDKLLEAEPLLENAVRDMEAALSIQSRNARWRAFLLDDYRALAKLYRQNGKHAELVTIARKVALLYPASVHDRIGALRWIAQSVALAQKDEAMNKADRATAVAEYTGHLYVGVTDTASLVEKDAHQAAELAWFLATLQDVGGRVDELALQLADNAVKLFPRNAIYRRTRGAVLLRLRRFPEAIEELTGAYSAMPKCGTALLLAKAHFAQGRKTEGEQWLNRIRLHEIDRDESLLAIFEALQQQNLAHEQELK